MATILTQEDVQKILAVMPERSRRTGAWVRPLFTVLWETGLRPITVLALEAGVHYTKGEARLFISEDVDKVGNKRHVPLSERAREALDLVYPYTGKGTRL